MISHIHTFSTPSPNKRVCLHVCQCHYIQSFIVKNHVYHVHLAEIHYRGDQFFHIITMYGQQYRLKFVNTSTIATHCHRIVNTASYVVKT